MQGSPACVLTAAPMRCLVLVVASAAALAPLVAKRDASSVSRRAFGAAAVAGAFVALPANAKIDVNNAMAREFSAYPCVEINQCAGCLLSHFSATTRPCWPRRAVMIATPSSRRRIDGVEVSEDSPRMRRKF